MVPINPDDPDAGTKRKTQAGFTTKGEAAKALRAAVTEVETGRVTVDTKVTVSQFAADWLAGRRASTSTVETYRRYVRLHIDPHIGSVPLVDLRAARIARLYRDLEARGNHDRGKEGTGLGPNSVRKVHALLVSILDGALAEHLIATNPAKLPQANPPTAREVKSAKPEIHPWTAAQLKAFLSWCPHDDTDLSMGWIVVGRTGLRRGELLGLQWRDVDLTGHKLSVRRAIVEVKSKGKPTTFPTVPPKNGRPRAVYLDTPTVNALRAQFNRLASIDPALVGADQAVFVKSDGMLIRPGGVWDRWRAAVDRYNRGRSRDERLPDIRVHDLRHTHATLLLEAQTHPKVVQERLGHANIAITLDLYSHVSPTTQQVAVQKFEAFMDATV
ncbi:tyrosine-type recombinase/integrase [Oerskovia sp. NPDC060338]|uniref:tyrosine-type recombinase/integrase n=1 Tax=Oerskovia sp. NPDC060338 TaxID=3347100 RepID=UPI0036476243